MLTWAFWAREVVAIIGSERARDFPEARPECHETLLTVGLCIRFRGWAVVAIMSVTLQSPRYARSQAGAVVLSFRSAHLLRHPVAPTPETLPSRQPDAERDARHAALLAAAAQGDARAFEEFYRLTIDLASVVVRRIAGPNQTEDVLSDAYFQAWQQAHLFDPRRGSALTWLLTTARSRALDRWRAERLRHGGLDGAPEFDAAAQEDAASPGPETLLEATQASQHLHAALTRLSANERWVLGLAYYRDQTHGEIAALTGLPLGTVKSLISRSQSKLREALTPAPRISAAPNLL